jgi:hypothetical protein
MHRNEEEDKGDSPGSSEGREKRRERRSRRLRRRRSGFRWGRRCGEEGGEGRVRETQGVVPLYRVEEEGEEAHKAVAASALRRPLMAAALSAVVEGGEAVEAARRGVASALMRARLGGEGAQGAGDGVGVRRSARGRKGAAGWR